MTEKLITYHVMPSANTTGPMMSFHYILEDNERLDSDKCPTMEADEVEWKKSHMTMMTRHG